MVCKSFILQNFKYWTRFLANKCWMLNFEKYFFTLQIFCSHFFFFIFKQRHQKSKNWRKHCGSWGSRRCCGEARWQGSAQPAPRADRWWLGTVTLLSCMIEHCILAFNYQWKIIIVSQQWLLYRCAVCLYLLLLMPRHFSHLFLSLCS